MFFGGRKGFEMGMCEAGRLAPALQTVQHTLPIEDTIVNVLTTCLFEVNVFKMIKKLLTSIYQY